MNLDLDADGEKKIEYQNDGIVEESKNYEVDWPFTEPQNQEMSG